VFDKIGHYVPVQVEQDVAASESTTCPNLNPFDKSELLLTKLDRRLGALQQGGGSEL